MSTAVEVRKDKLKVVNLTDIQVGQRFREDLGDLDALKESIQDKGVLQPITLDENLNLLAGGRRVAACQALGLPRIPALIRPFHGEIDSREVELIENVHRKDFTWQEECALVQELDKLYKEKDGNWSNSKTAQLLDRSKGLVSRNLQLARALEAVPQIGEYKTADEAFRILKKLEEDTIVSTLRDRQKQGMNGKEGDSKIARSIRNVLKIANDNYQVKDTFLGMSELRTNGVINIIECDPPYGVDLNSVRKEKLDGVNLTKDYEEIPKEDYPAFLKKLCSELYRIAGKDCWMLFWYGSVWHTEVLTTLRGAGWQVDSIPALWVKPNGQTPQPDLLYARCYEPFFLCRKGNPILIESGHGNVFLCSSTPSNGPNARYHPTQRPVKLIEEIFQTLGAGRQIVFCPFLGSGATLRACYNLGFLSFGYDCDGRYKDKFMLAVEEDCRVLLTSDTTHNG